MASRAPTPRAYRFGVYRIDEYLIHPAARELRRDGELLSLPRRVFDGLAYLVEQRERAVGHDELIAALWGRVDVANAQLSQLIMQVRRAVGDDSQAQHSVRTIAGFGYRWVVPTEAIDTDEAPAEAPSAAPAAEAATVEANAARSTDQATPPRAHRRIGAILLTALVFAVLLTAGWRLFAPRPLANASGEAVIVLPFEVDAPEEVDASWARLGVMDQVAGRLRRAGLPVPPSDAVVAAVHASAALPEAEREAALRRTLGAGLLVHGVATHAKDGWTVELSADAADDARRRVESGRYELVDSARRASDLLLTALGRHAADEAATDTPLEERLQRARAALLANQLDAGRAAIESAPDAMREAPELRYELARVEFHAGQLDRAEAIVERVLADPAAAALPQLRARALRMRGWIAIGKDRGWAAAAPSFDASVHALDGVRAPGALGMALAERGVAHVMLRQLDAAALDFGQARAQLEIAGDRHTLGEMNNYLGHLELARLRVGEALPYFRTAAEIAESFGSIDSLRYNLTALLQSQMRLLQWPDALATGERLWALRERLENTGLRAASEGYYAMALIGNGRLAEAERVLAPYPADAQPDFAPEYLRYALLARAELAARRGQSRESLAAASRALEVWPPESNAEAEERARAALLRQRASIAVGEPAEARIDALEPRGDPGFAVPDRVARAEWAAAHGSGADAEALLREAADLAETQGVPDGIVLASGAYVPWLLARQRTADAAARSGRAGVWADRDFDSALLQAAVFHAGGEPEAWTRALQQARQLAGERTIPAVLLEPPTVVASR
ncbi:winged helix-turn-helix domain-containing protein [Dokdonella sp.]|uniref:winged helix-turn-helix domain-containing protein n=1 Tax=Dokdonella sp. TaxID=2291710 RepID=UPI001B2E8445|nr:winged helix-turn-helix domain-containing protein [Dokdonella sp.]MBO9663429.1 winged helix-turn-helix domain-containing protein [Dokdonella sp.]